MPDIDENNNLNKYEFGPTLSPKESLSKNSTPEGINIKKAQEYIQ